MTDDILLSVKSSCGIVEDDDSFNAELIPSINAELFALTQIGIGLVGYSISDDDHGTWSDYNPDYPSLNGAISEVIGLRVKLTFDGGLSSMAKESIEKKIDRLEWRLNIAADPTED